jgi:hypothetical protein
MADLADPATAAVVVSVADVDRDGALGGEGDNKFQRAISAWRSTTTSGGRWKPSADFFLQILISLP